MSRGFVRLVVVLLLVLNVAGTTAVAGFPPVPATCAPLCSADPQSSHAPCPPDGQLCAPQAGCHARCATERNAPLVERLPRRQAMVLVAPVPRDDARQPAPSAAAAPFRPPRNAVTA